MRILGIDPGLRTTGFGLIEAEGQRLAYEAIGTISTTELARGDLPGRLKIIFDGVCEVVQTYRHTSAGRVPTPRGYRLFVDSLITLRPLAKPEIFQIENALLPDDPQRLVSAASQLLAELTHFAGVVATPKRRSQCSAKSNS